ncbi:EcsC family protein [Paenibacillus sp. JX-17]|uniref:EcsC family protein n=1 Tax=Paenibacillus lacisoli TaxID=3064525 RepID=A0ABT9CD10_9BACL|nr:EcsC family protein [Paenibacillus sp. JX-17]MDO7907157.1 EcsC family protein [Paenibacillus sp. JX-17]
MTSAWETREELQSQLNTITKWEKSQKDIFFWEKIGRLPFMLLDRLTPKWIQDKIGAALNEVGGFIQNGGKYLVQKRSVLSELEQTWVNLREHGAGRSEMTINEAASLPLAVMDHTAEELAGKRAKFAAAQGATTGFGGIFTLAVDIPMVLGMSLKVLQEMAICYGYDPEDKQERVFIIKCMQFASADIVGKKAVLEELAVFDQAHSQAQVISQLQGWREVVNSYRDNFGWKKLFQMVPIAGMFIGSFMNKGTIEDVAEAGRMLYKKRRILSRLADVPSLPGTVE